MAKPLRGSNLGGYRGLNLPDPVAAELAPRYDVVFRYARGHAQTHAYAVEANEPIPTTVNCRRCGTPAHSGSAQPGPTRSTVYKTHLEYVQLRRTPQQAEEILTAALAALRDRHHAPNGPRVVAHSPQASRLPLGPHDAPLALEKALSDKPKAGSDRSGR